MATLLISILVSLGSSLVHAQTTVVIPASAGSSAVRVDSSFVNTGFEFTSLPYFAQTSPSDGSANQYSINLLNALFEKSGGRPVLRIGGITGDGYKFDQNLAQPVGNNAIGPSFWKLPSLLSSTNALFLPQLSLTDTNDTHQMQDAAAMMQNIGLANIVAVEVGNEPNEYGGHNSPYANNKTYYASRFQHIAGIAAKAMGISPTTPFFAGPDLASYDLRSTDFTIQDIFSFPDFNKGNIKLGTDHWYLCGGTCSIPGIMNHQSMVQRSATIVKASQYFQSSANTYGVEYVLDEFNVLTGPANLTFSASLGTALATVDFLLYAMAQGVHRVNLEQVFGSNQAAWIPQSSGGFTAQTRSGYYALITASEFIGGTNSNTRVEEITLGSGNSGETFSAYMAYNGTIPNRIALLNLNYWDQSQGSSRPVETVQVKGLSSMVSKVAVKYLTNPGGAAQDASATTFGGSQWPYSTLGKEKTGVEDTDVEVTVSNGVAQVPCPFSSVAIVYLS